MDETPEEVRIPSPYERVVLPVEGSSEEMLAQQGAVEMAAAAQVPVVAVHVATGVEEPPEDVFDYVSRLCKELSVPFEHRLLHAPDVSAELIEELGSQDLVVIGTRELGKGNGSASVANALIEQAPCPVQVVRVK